MTTRRVLVAGLLPALTAIPIRGSLANGCSTMALVLKDTQQGFAGTTGTVWTIAPDCTFQVARLFGDRVLAPHIQGRLDEAQKSRLAAALERTHAGDLPAQLGEGSVVNPRHIVLERDGRTAALSLSPGDTDVGKLLAASPDDPARRMFELAAAVKDILGS